MSRRIWITDLCATVSVLCTREGSVACCASSLAYHGEHLPDEVQVCNRQKGRTTTRVGAY